MFVTPNNFLQIKEVSDDYHSYTMMLSTEFLRNLHIDLKNTIPAYMEIKNNPKTKATLEDQIILEKFYILIQEIIESDDTFRKTETIQGLIIAFTNKIGSIYYRDKDISSKVEFPHSRKDVFFRKFMTELAQHHKTERSVGFYAQQLHITPKYLSSLIKEATHKSAAQWIDEYVILEAKTLLKFSEMSIQEVAYHLNFASQSFFGKYFKHHTGMSPSEYKKS